MIRLIILLGLIILTTQPSNAEEAFESWLLSFRAEALSHGITAQTFESALGSATPIQKVIDLDRKQPEGRLTFEQYKSRVINDLRIRQGKALMKKYHDLLKQVSDKYNVQPQYLVALWGMETSYGKNTGGFSVPQSLATLAYEGRRASFFRKELLEALKIIDQGHISAEKMKGSWAGAMGQNQFMPSSFKAYAVDFNGDGKRNIWESTPDVLGSSANYLHSHGWKGDERWGRPVKLPAGFNPSWTGLDHIKTLEQWKKLGILTQAGNPVPVVEGMKASIITPDGITGPAFLVYDNFRVIMKWNKSSYFATSVGILADHLSY